MAKIEIPELSQALGQLSNASVVLVDEFRSVAQVSTGLLQNITSALSGAITELSSTFKGINGVIPGAIAKTSGSVQSSIDLNSPAVHFALITLAIFLIASTIFCLCSVVYKGLKIARFAVDWCNGKPTKAVKSRTPAPNGTSFEEQKLIQSVP